MTEHPVKRRKKLIEVAIPLEAINAASAREKCIRHGHPSTLHLWWARRPLAAARAVIFCQMVDDPSAVPEEFPTEEDQENERLRLFALISELVLWENTTNEEVLNRAREEIRRSWRRCCADNADHPEAPELFNPEKLPGFHDPFAGGGALPLEAQRLGLEAYASDLNPVAVLINKAMIEIPPKFAGMPSVNPEARSKKQLIAREWKGAEGLAEDVRYYGKWMRDEAEKRIGHLYPKVRITPEMVNDPENPRPDLKPYEGQEFTVIAWMWARTVRSPNPVFSHVSVPLASTFLLSTKSSSETYVHPHLSHDNYRFVVKTGKPKDHDKTRNGTKLSRGANFYCVMSETPIPSDYIYSEANAGQISTRLMAVIVETTHGRLYLSPTSEIEEVAMRVKPSWKPELQIPENPRWFSPPLYGFKSYGDLFTPRQLVALTTFADLVSEAKSVVKRDIESNADLLATPEVLRSPEVYADAIALCLALSTDRLADRNSTLCGWDIAQAARGREATVRNVFSRQAMPMVWDFVEVNLLADTAGSYDSAHKAVIRVVESLQSPLCGHARSADASTQDISKNRLVSTDPPYYDNIGYADLSDFFYVWLRRALRSTFPELFTTLAVPKSEELVATPYRHGGKENAESFFLNGMTRAMQRISEQSHPAFPVSIYYAFKQSETKTTAGTASTGWETFLAAVLKAGFALHGTWPMRTELANRMIGAGTNALASSIVLVCKRRDTDARIITRKQFRDELKKSLPLAIKKLEHANIAPVDVAQASIGPGMAIFSTASAVLNTDDSPMTVREALVEINAALDEYLSQDEGELDPDSRFALTFFESFGYQERDYGDAEGLAVARNISVAGVAEAGILRSVAGKVRLLQRSELPDDWDPTRDKRLCVWEATQHLIKRLEADGESGAAALLLQLKNLSGRGDLAANCRALAYRLYNHCEKTKQAEEARSYNGLVIAWPELERQASAASTAQSSPLQTSLI
jgi:putative DNA methylase